NEVFGDFKSEGVDQLVLDLRYNGGGAVATSQLLSSMISNQGCSDVFAEYDYNQKRSEENNSIYFLDEVPLQDENGDFFGSYREGQCFDYNNTIPINRLSLNKVYVLVSNATASASEALINGLRPYIDVTVIGTQTIGKDQAALLLCDAPPPYTDDDKANEEHTKAIQPIVSKFTNADDETYPYEYTNSEDVVIDAFKPTGKNNISEITEENLKNKPAIGDPEDPLLARAISLITGQPAKLRLQRDATVLQEIQPRSGIQDLRPHGNGMYIEPFMIPTSRKQ